MNNGCNEGRASRLRVCSISEIAQQQENACASAAADDGDTVMVMERDYIGYSMARAAQEDKSACNHHPDDGLDCGNVELSLALGRSDSILPQGLSSANQSSSSGSEHLTLNSGVNLQRFWHQNFRCSFSNELVPSIAGRPLAPETSNQALSSHGRIDRVGRGPVPGLFTVPAPKVSTTPAKRSYAEASEERRAVDQALHSSTQAEAAYAWNPGAFGPSSFGGARQLGHVYGEAHAHRNTVGTACHASAMEARLAGGAPPARTSPEQNGCSSRVPPVVGWPPIRSYRRSSLQIAQASDRVNAEEIANGVGGAAEVALQDLTDGASIANRFFVKARLDGVRICRKVDLKAHDNYNGLKAALQEMFQAFVSDPSKLDLLTGNNYVLTHEDKDGDCLLVGDVPWPMFVDSSVKSLRIMKAKDAIGIGEKGAPKAKAQDNIKPQSGL